MGRIKPNKDKQLATKFDTNQIAPTIAKEIRNVEDMGTSMMQTAQEYTLAIEDILIRKFDFTEDQLKVLEKELIQMLTTLAEFERNGFSVLNPKDMAVVGEIAHSRYKRLSKNNEGKLLPPSAHFKIPDKIPGEEIVEKLKSNERKKNSKPGKVIK